MGCEDQSSMFFSEGKRKLTEEIVLNTNWVEVSIQPVLEIKNQVQYITLALPNANLWRTGNDGVSLVMDNGNRIDILVDLETSAGKWFELRSISIGKTLMFSYLEESSMSGDSDLPQKETIKAFRIKASLPIMINEINWVDVTNK